MKNVIVASFKEESKAITALHKLNELQSYGDIAIYENVMVRKNADGKIEVLKDDDSEGWRTLTGMTMGGLLGMLGGPVGFIVGLYTGTAVGAVADASRFDFEEDFMAKVVKKIEPGTVAIVAEIDEDGELFVDSYLKPLGAVISRSDFDLEFDKHDEEEIEELEAEMAMERAALKKAVGDDKKKIQKKIDQLQEKRRSKMSEFTAKAKSGFEKVKSDIEAIGNGISEELKKEKLERIKRRIDRHADKLNTLNAQLKKMQD